MSVFDNEPEHVRQQAEQIIMQRVQLMRGGMHEVLDGDHLIKEFVQPEPESEPESESTPAPEPAPENSEADSRAP